MFEATTAKTQAIADAIANHINVNCPINPNHRIDPQELLGIKPIQTFEMGSAYEIYPYQWGNVIVWALYESDGNIRVMSFCL